MRNTDPQDPTTWLFDKAEADQERQRIKESEALARSSLSRDTLARMARRFAARFKDKHGAEPGSHFAAHTLAH